MGKPGEQFDFELRFPDTPAVGETVRLPRIVLASVGTDGDLHPYHSLGRVLVRRGFPVTLAAHAHFAERAAQDGMEFVTLVTQAETEALLREPNLWHALLAPWVISRWGRTLLRRQWSSLRAVATRGEPVWMVANPGVLAARLLEDELSVPTLSVALQPWILPSLESPPVMLGVPTLRPNLPRCVGRLYYAGFEAVGRLLVGQTLNRLRRESGLSPVRRVFQWWLAPRGVLALFPRWFAGHPSDWPSQVRLCGFPDLDGMPERELPPAVEGLLSADRPVIAVTFGTGMLHASALFAEAVQACRSLGMGAVLLTSHRNQLPEQLPPEVVGCDFAPFQRLFPRCAAVVHHGGIGTTAKALAAGTPQLILPFAFDQLDNACRVSRLGAGEWLPLRRRRAADWVEALPRLLTPAVRGRCREVAQLRPSRSGLDVAADEIERAVASGRSR